MSKKSLKVFVILLVLFSVCTICSSAANINLNLPGTGNDQVNNNTVENNQNDVNSVDTNVVDTNNVVDNMEENIIDNPLDDMQTLTPNASTSSNSGLSTTNIINILLITVGVILILLAIAIMIRLK